MPPAPVMPPALVVPPEPFIPPALVVPSAPFMAPLPVTLLCALTAATLADVVPGPVVSSSSHPSAKIIAHAIDNFLIIVLPQIHETRPPGFSQPVMCSTIRRPLGVTRLSARV